MFIRETKTRNKKTGTIYMKYQLVESYRSEKGPRQRVILDLGSEYSLSKQDRRELAAILKERLCGQSRFFSEAYPELARVADEVMRQYDFVQSQSVSTAASEEGDLISVDLQSLGFLQQRSLGPDLIGHAFWDKLGFDEILAECGFSKRQLALAQAVVVGRLVAPSSDLATFQWLKERSALIEVLEVDLSTVGKDAVYEIADKLWKNKSAIEQALRAREDLLFPGRSSLFLYDLTNTIRGATQEPLSHYFSSSCPKLHRDRTVIDSL